MPSAATAVVSLMLVGHVCLSGPHRECEAAVSNDGESRQARHAMTVVVLNRARTLPETLAEAEGHAARVYRRSGIEIIWHHIPAGDEPEPGVLTVPAESRRPIVVVNVMSASMEAGASVPPRALGVAAPDDLVVHILHGRVERLAEATGARLPEVLGYTLAHEIGHILLPLRAHAVAGIMSATLNTKEMAQGALWFGKGQAILMREELRRLGQARNIGAVTFPNGRR